MHARAISAHPGSPKDLWGWKSVHATGDANLRAITAPVCSFPAGHEALFIVGRTRAEALAARWGGVQWRGASQDWTGFFDTRKAERMVGSAEAGYPVPGA
jgi:hypothetical protein